MTTEVPAEDPAGVSRAMQDTTDVAGDAADQAERLTMVMEAEALRNALHGDPSGEGSLDGYDYPLEDSESVLAMEGAEDSSDDPMHAGGLDPAPWVPAERAAMHVVSGESDEWDGRPVDEMLDDEDADIDPFDRPGGELTAEDETLLGIDPYEDGDTSEEGDDER